MLAGIKPTVGRVSRYGVIPITADQDIAGPMARTITDVAIMLGALVGIPQALYYDSVQVPGADRFRSGLSDAGKVMMAEAIEILSAQGATIVDPADIPSVIDPEPTNSLLTGGAAACLVMA
jgi:amidase